MLSKYIYTINFILLTPVLAILVVFFAGGGHGTYEPIIWLFPYTALSALLFDTINPLFALLGITQFPIYGYIIDRARNKGNNVLQFFLGILILHLLVLAICFLLKPEQF